MKWNATSVTAACLSVGLGGFVVGKLTGGPGSGNETDELIERARQVSTERTSAGRSENDARRNSADRPTRPGGNRSATTTAERLDNMETIIRSENALDRGRAMLSWIDSLNPSEFQAAVERFRGLGLTQERMGEYAMLLTAWAEQDPTAALTYTTENTKGSMATNTILTAWATRDPESAIAWAETNYKGDNANPYIAGIIRGIVGTDPIRATELLQNLPFSAERGEALRGMIPSLLQLGSESAKQWIAALSDERLKDGATARFAEEMAKKDPAGTAAWLLSNLGTASTHSVDEVFGEWAKTDKTAALKSYEQLPEGDARSRALRGLVTAEARSDPQAAANLMNLHPADIDDHTVMRFIWTSFDEAPGIAANQIGLIKNERIQNRMYQRTLSSWLKEEPAVAQRWIDSANLPPAVLKSLPQRQP